MGACFVNDLHIWGTGKNFLLRDGSYSSEGGAS